MFGISFTELLLIATVTLLVVGPSRLPAMLGTLGRWSNKLRRTLFEVRHQSGIDEILRSEGITGGLTELRELRDVVRGDLRGVGRNLTQRALSRPPPGNTSATAAPATGSANAATSPGTATTEPAPHAEDPYAGVPYDRSREYPDEGADAYGALPDDLWELGAASSATSQAATNSSGEAPPPGSARSIPAETAPSAPSAPAATKHPRPGVATGDAAAGRESAVPSKAAPVKSGPPRPAPPRPAPPRPAPRKATGSETQRESAEAAGSPSSTTIDAHGHER